MDRDSSVLAGQSIRELHGRDEGRLEGRLPDAILQANNSQYGGIFGLDRKSRKGNTDCSGAPFGCNWVNTHQNSCNGIATSGLKKSGYGSDLSVTALDDCSINRHIMIAH